MGVVGCLSHQFDTGYEEVGVQIAELAVNCYQTE